MAFSVLKMQQIDLNRLFFQIILGIFLFATVAEAQDNATDQMLIKAGYLLSAESNKLSILREKITEIRRKKIGLNPENDPELSQISMLITNLFWVETICSYESLLLSSFQDVAEAKKPDYYRKQYSRLKNVTLKKMYFNFKSTQSNFANIADPEICQMSMLITNIFWIETTCIYESLLLSSLQNVAEGKKSEYYRKHYSRLKTATLKKMYLNFKSTQSNFANIQDPEILALSGNVKKELLKVLRLIEEEIDLLEDQIQKEN